MSKVRLAGSKAERLKQIDTACQIIEEESHKQMEEKRRNWSIFSKYLSTETEEDEGFLAEHPLGRG